MAWQFTSPAAQAARQVCWAVGVLEGAGPSWETTAVMTIVDWTVEVVSWARERPARARARRNFILVFMGRRTKRVTVVGMVMNDWW